MNTRLIALLVILVHLGFQVTLVAADSGPSSAALPFAEDFRAFANADAATAPSQGGVLFVGSSIFRQWTNVAEAMAPLPVLNRAFGGSRTGDQLVRFEQLVPPYSPKIVVYYCGSNDLKAGDLPEVIFDRFKAFSGRVHQALPDSDLVFVSSTRSPDRVDKWDRVERYNALVRDFCASYPRHTFVDINPILLGAEGKPRLDFYQDDQLHLRPAAYVAIAERLKPVLQRVWQEQKATH